MMSLFDVIRYPISDIPKEEELNALPRDLYNKIATKMRLKIDMQKKTHYYDGRTVVDSFRTGANLPTQEPFDVSRIRQMILEYNDDI